MRLREFWSHFFRLFCNLVSCLLKLIVLKVEHLLECKWLFRVAVSSKGIEDFWEFRLAYDCVLDLANIFIGEDQVSLMNSKLEWQEKNWNCCLCTFSDFYLLKFTEVGLWDTNCFLFEICLWVFLFALGSRGWSLSLWVFLLRVFLIFVILNLNIEHYVLRECIFDLEVYLESLIQLCRLLNYFNRVPLIDVGN